MMTNQVAKRVVVLGGGYAGLAFVQGLRRAGLQDIEITLVDRNPYHTLLTETHTVAAGRRGAHRVEIPFDCLGSGVRVVKAFVHGVDKDARLVFTDTEILPYDVLAFGLGGRDADFGIKGVREHGLSLRSRADAERIRDRLTALPPGAGVVIVGGGLTGVELAAEIGSAHAGRVQVTVVEAADHLLPGLPEPLQNRARRRLGWLGVNVLTGARVTAVAADRLHLQDGTVLTAGLIIWAAGVRGHPLAAAMGLPTDRSGRVPVDAHLRCGVPDVYVLGDSAAVATAPGQPALPPSAQLAEQMGFTAAADLASRLRGGSGVTFEPHLKGVLCDLGGFSTIGLVYRFRVYGLAAYAAKRLAVLGHLWRTTGLKGFLLHLRREMRDLLASAKDRAAH